MRASNSSGLAKTYASGCLAGPPLPRRPRPADPELGSRRQQLARRPCPCRPRRARDHDDHGVAVQARGPVIRGRPSALASTRAEQSLSAIARERRGLGDRRSREQSAGVDLAARRAAPRPTASSRIAADRGSDRPLRPLRGASPIARPDAATRASTSARAARIVAARSTARAASTARSLGIDADHRHAQPPIAAAIAAAAAAGSSASVTARPITSRSAPFATASWGVADAPGRDRATPRSRMPGTTRRRRGASSRAVWRSLGGEDRPPQPPSSATRHPVGHDVGRGASRRS